MGLKKLAWPSFITSSLYANRCVTFIAMKNEPVEDPNELLKLCRDMGRAVNIVDEGSFTSEVSIVLPMPDELMDEQTHSWSQETSLMHDAATGAMQGLMETDGGEVAGAKIHSPLQSAIQKMAAGFIRGTLGNPDKLLARLAYATGRRKPLLDPGYFQNYTGSEPRSFAMSWTMIPESQDEASNIRDIVTAFKRYSSPSISVAGVSMLAPYFFNVTIGNEVINNLFHTSMVVCVGIDVVYSSQVFMDGMPKQIQLTLRFKEAKLNYADNYGSSFDKGGGGEPQATEQSTSTGKTVSVDASGDVV